MVFCTSEIVAQYLVCGIVCSRPKISLCKKTVCLGSSYQNEAFVSVNVEKSIRLVGFFSLFTLSEQGVHHLPPDGCKEKHGDGSKCSAQRYFD